GSSPAVVDRPACPPRSGGIPALSAVEGGSMQKNGVKPVPHGMRTVTPHLTVHGVAERSEEHTSELQSLAYLVCRLLLEKDNLHSCCRLRRCPARASPYQYHRHVLTGRVA